MVQSSRPVSNTLQYIRRPTNSISLVLSQKSLENEYLSAFSSFLPAFSAVFATTALNEMIFIAGKKKFSLVSCVCAKSTSISVMDGLGTGAIEGFNYHGCFTINLLS